MMTHIDLPEINNELQWLEDHLLVENHEVPDWILDLTDGSTPDNIDKRFSQFGIMAFYMIRNQTHFSIQQLDDAALYVFRLYLSFWVERLRRNELIDFTAFPLFNVEQLDALEIHVLNPMVLGQQELNDSDRIVAGKKFLGGFWD